MAFDVDLYLHRIGRDGGSAGAPATLETLTELMRAHVRAIPFENLDPVSGRPPSLELDDIAAKLVAGGRGGYCYEHNTLFAAVLAELGFDVTLHAGRVVVGARVATERPRTHMLLLVHLADEPAPYLADVGFGSIGSLLEPIRLAPGATLEDAPRSHRLVRTLAPAAAKWMLQAHDEDEWADQYLFTEEQYFAPDFKMFNWYVATYPTSPFRNAPYVQRTFPDRHLALDGRTLTETDGAGKQLVRELSDHDEVVAVLRAEFGIRVPDYFASPA